MNKLEKIKSKYGENAVLIGVYGTLRLDQSNHHCIKDDGSIYLGTVETKPIYTMYNLGGFPGLVKDGTDSAVVEVFAVANPSVQSRVDRLEGYRGEEFNDPSVPGSNMYNKELINTEFGPTYIYIYNGTPYSRHINIIKHGDWTKRFEKEITETLLATENEIKN